MMFYLRLFLEFFRTGLFTVGGGLAALPFLYDISNRTGWYTHAQLIDMIAVSESTPGPIGVNMATYVGFTLRGVPGSLVATFALVLPTIVIAYFVSRALDRFRQNPLVNAAFYGLRPAVCGLIANACWGIVRVSLFDFEATGFFNVVNIPAFVIFGAAFFLIRRYKKLHPIVSIAGGAVLGVVVGALL